MGEHQVAEGGLDGAGGTEGVASQGLGGGAAGRVLAKERGDGGALHLVVVGGAGAVEVDVVHGFRREMGIFQGCAHCGQGAASVGFGSGEVIGIGALAHASELNLSAPGFHHKEGGPFAEVDAIAPGCERLCGLGAQGFEGEEAALNGSRKAIDPADDDGLAGARGDEVARGGEDLGTGGTGGGDCVGWTPKPECIAQIAGRSGHINHIGQGGELLHRGVAGAEDHADTLSGDAREQRLDGLLNLRDDHIQ